MGVDKLLAGFTLINCFTQERNKLILSLKKDGHEYFVEINTDQMLPYFIIRNKFNRAKKNTLDFFEAYLPSTLKSISIAEFDRVIKFQLEIASIYFYIRGKETNVVLIEDTNGLKSFKKIEDEEKLIEELCKLNFSNKFHIPFFEEDSVLASTSVLSKKYPFLGKEIIDEYQKRVKLNAENEQGFILKNILNEIQTSKPFVYQNSETGKSKLSFFNHNESESDKITLFDTVNDALIFFLFSQKKNEKSRMRDRECENSFEKKLERLEKKRNALLSRINDGCKDRLYQQIANLILMNLGNIERGTAALKLENIYDSNRIIAIDLKPELDLKENIQHYFDKAKSERKDFERAKYLLTETVEKIEKLKVSYIGKNEMDNDQSHPNSSGSSKSKEDRKNLPKTVGSKFRQFILYEKHLILVGKNSKNNDELTTGFAKQNDYWFHARSVSGSHVVLRHDKSQGEVQKIVLEKAASLAAFYSKAKTSGLVPVSYTQKKYVIKRKGMEPGKVVLLKEKVLIVRPEIPKECRIITD